MKLIGYFRRGIKIHYQPINCTAFQLFLIKGMILHLGKTMEYLPHNTNTKDIDCYFHD